MVFLIKRIWLICLIRHIHVGWAKPQKHHHNALEQVRERNFAAWRAQVAVNAAVGNNCGASADPNILPYKNMAAALNGYDLPKSDPFSSTLVDPGWRHQIFEHTKQDDRGCTVPEFGISSTDLNSCTGKLSSDVITSYQGYRKKKLKSFKSGHHLQWGNEIDVKAEYLGVSASTTIPPMVTRDSAESESDENIANFFSQEKGVMVFREAHCITHRILVDNFDLPSFTRGFKKSVRKFYNAPESTRTAVFKKMIESYGTHYSSETIMGAKFSHFSRYSGVNRKTQDSSLFKKCSEIKGLKILWFQVEKDKSECQQFYSQNNKFHSKNVEQSYWTSYGSRPAETLIEWARQTLENPIPIRMKFEPIPNLFTDDLMTRFDPGINATLLKSWFIPLYLDYCNLFNLDCAPRLGCGLSGDCGWKDTCVAAPTHLGGYRCYKYILGNTNENCDRACESQLQRSCDFATVNSLRDTEIKDILKSLDSQASCNAWNKAPVDIDQPFLSEHQCFGWGSRETSTTKADCSYLDPEWSGRSRRLCQCDQDTCTNHVCRNGGKCRDEDGHHTCQCKTGFSGSHCQNREDTCVAVPESLGGYRCYKYILGNTNENCHRACERQLQRSCDFATVNSLRDLEIQDILVSLESQTSCTAKWKVPTSFDEPYLFDGNICVGWGTRENSTKKADCSYLDPKWSGRSRRLCQCDQDTCTNHVCQNGGKCRVVDGHHTCQCKTGFSGNHCQNINFVSTAGRESCTVACQIARSASCSIPKMEEILLAQRRTSNSTRHCDEVFTQHLNAHPSFGSKCVDMNASEYDSLNVTCGGFDLDSCTTYGRLCECCEDVFDYTGQLQSTFTLDTFNTGEKGAFSGGVLFRSGALIIGGAVLGELIGFYWCYHGIL